MLPVRGGAIFDQQAAAVGRIEIDPNAVRLGSHHRIGITVTIQIARNNISAAVQAEIPSGIGTRSPIRR